MSILHGSWIVTAGETPYFFLWGEAWRRLTTEEPAEPVHPRTHPFVMDAQDFWQFVADRQPEFVRQLPATKAAKAARWTQQIINLPTTDNQIGAGPIAPWLVMGARLTPIEAFQFLVALPLSRLGQDDAFFSGDLRFWSHVARWGLDLLARGKYLPHLLDNLSRWQVRLDSGTDQARLNMFAGQMPTVCRMYGGTEPIPLDLIIDFLNHLVDAQVRQIMRPSRSTGTKTTKTTKKTTIGSPLQPWLDGLLNESAVLTHTENLAGSLDAWLAPLQQPIQEFCTCLSLVPPSIDDARWRLEYGLQAIDDRQFVVPASLVWQHSVDRFDYQGRTLIEPQETLLRGMGLATRIYGVLESSLQTAQPIDCVLTPIEAYQFLRESAWRLQENGIGVVLPPSLANRDGWANRLGLKVQATTLSSPTQSQLIRQKIGMQGLLNFQWELAIGGHSLTKPEFDRLVALNSPLVEINGDWVELRPADIRSAQNFFAARQNQTQLTLEDALRLSNGDTQTIEKLPVVSFEASGALQQLVTNLADSQSIEPIHPGNLQGELRPYQARGVGWLAFLEQWGLGACLADDMGLGKTLQLIAFVLHLAETGLLEQPIVIICPTSVLGNWQREVNRFAPSLKVLVHHGDKRSQGQAFVKQAPQYHLVITSYALVARDLNTLKKVPWQGIVLDEAQNIKNPEAKQSHAVRQLALPVAGASTSQFRIAMTGTPVENRLSELWSIMDFLNPGYLGTKQYFQRRFAIPIEQFGDATSLQALRALAQPFLLRRLKTDKTIIQDLPEKQEMTVFCGLSSQQAELYQKLVEENLATIDTSTGIQRRGLILGLLTRLKQVCNHPNLVTKQDSGADFGAQSGKLQRLQELLDIALAEGDRVLIFTQFAEWGKQLQQYIQQQMGRETLYLYGSTPQPQREAMVDQFQHDPQAPQIFILSLKAGGVGLNLTRANHVFHFDRWWNPAVENQATDRVFRIGQQRNVQVHKFVCNGTLEERIHEMIESKKALTEQVIGTGENWLTEMNTDQLRELLVLDRSAILGEET
jgi:SNF2 family DNA or RNA helicase